MAIITIRIMTHDRSRCAEVTLPDSLTVGELVDQCRPRWQLESSEVYAVRLIGQNRRLYEDDSLLASGVSGGMELQLFPLVEGG
jgi:hypothetical protein